MAGMAVLARDEATGEAKEIINYPRACPESRPSARRCPDLDTFPSIAVT